jgi:putative ABC transport system permease protein
MLGEGNDWTGSPGFGFLDGYCRDLPGVERMSLFTEAGSSVGFVNGAKVISELRRTDGEYWDILDFRFLEGRPFTAGDVENAANVAVISASARRRFFGDGPAVGRNLETGGQNFTVVGVVEDVPHVRMSAYGDVWVPYTTARSDAYKTRLMGNFNAILLARSRDDFRTIRSEFRRRLPLVQMPDPASYGRMEGAPRNRFEELAAQMTGTTGPDHSARTTELVLVFALGMLLFMLLPAINLVNLNISRILERASEIGIRKAFGATSTDLVGQFLLENIVLALAGGAVGFLASFWGLDLINRSGWIPHADFQVNLRLFLYALALSATFGIISGVYPAWRMSRLDPVDALRGASR